MKILAICPSIYPDKLSKMMESFNNTKSEFTDIVVYTEIGSVTEIFNKAFNEHKYYDFYFMCNDDIIFRTDKWDLKLANKGKISYGNDLFQRDNLCSFPMIDGDIVRALGWLQMPKLERYTGDVIWKFMGVQLGILNYVEEVVIEHTWSGCSDPEMNTRDTQNFANWLPFSFRDINKIRSVL